MQRTNDERLHMTALIRQSLDHMTSGRHEGLEALYTDDAINQEATLKDGRIAEHRAQRDDLGMARQLHWTPPTPRYLVRMARARRRAQRDHPGPSGSNSQM